MSNELERMRERVHDDLAIHDQDGIDIPCIIVDPSTLNEIVSQCKHKMTKVDGKMNVMYDKEGHVFVDLQFTVPEFDIIEEFLIDASQHLDFFAAFAKSGMLGIASSNSEHDTSDIFTIQMPRIDNIRRSFDIICRELEQR